MTFIGDTFTDKEAIVSDTIATEAFESESPALEGDLYSFEYPDSNPDWYPDEEDYKAFGKKKESQEETTEHSELDTQIIDINEERSKDEENENTLINELVTTVDGERNSNFKKLKIL